MLLASAATCFVPHPGKMPSKARDARIAATSRPAEVAASARVTVATEFRLPPSAYDHLIAEAARRHGLNPALIRAVIATESGFDPMAVSAAGAQGLMQLMPALSAELGVLDPFDPRENIMAGSWYLSQLLAAADDDVELALASYNAGPGTVDRYQGMPPYPETRRYVKTITELLRRETRRLRPDDDEVGGG
jgi:soluble lytic murein transglycosylase-like protein